MDHFISGHNRRNGSDAQRLHFVREERTIDHGVVDSRIENGNHIEGLHHIGTIRTREGYIGFQLYRPIDTADSILYSFIGDIPSDTVIVENSKKQ